MINICDLFGHPFESSFEITLNHLCTSNFPNLNFLGVIIEISKGLANVYWHSGKVYWIETKLLEVIHNESR